jgi:hypothetical protein
MRGRASTGIAKVYGIADWLVAGPNHRRHTSV